MDGVGSDIVFDRMGGAIDFECKIVGVVAAFVIGEGNVGGSEISAVKDDNTVGVEELHVHGGDTNVGEEEVPLAATRSGECQNDWLIWQ